MKTTEKNTIQKQKITTEEMWKSLVFEFISSGKRGKSNFYEHIRTSHRCEKSKTLKKYDNYEIEYDNLVNSGKDELIVEAENERLKTAIIDKHKRMEILSKIALGEIQLQKALVLDKEIKYIEVIPDWMDRKNAIAELNKMDGSYAPIKNEHTGKDGKPLVPNKFKVIIKKKVG